VSSLPGSASPYPFGRCGNRRTTTHRRSRAVSSPSRRAGEGGTRGRKAESAERCDLHRSYGAVRDGPPRRLR
jgi:hypothetical protein